MVSDPAADTSWQLQSASAHVMTDVAYGNGTFLTMGYYPGDVSMTSPDGITWTSRTVPSADWASVDYDNNLFVASSYSGQLMTSPDGLTWTTRTVPAETWADTTYGEGLFLTVGPGNVIASPDGVTWSARTVDAGGNYSSAAYGNGMFVVVANGGNPRLIYSDDSISWNAADWMSLPDGIWNSVAFGNGIFVAVGSGTNRIMTSTDGISWTARTAPETNNWSSVTFAAGLFVAVGYSGTNRVMTSTDGITWTMRPAAAAYGWGAVTYGTGAFVAVTSDWESHRVMRAQCLSGG